MNKFNYQKRRQLIFDGLDDFFLSRGTSVPCPLCDGVIDFGLYNSKDFDDLNEKEKIELSKKISGIKRIGGEVTEFRCYNSPLIYAMEQCSIKKHNMLVIFTYKEIQPARYECYLVGLFNQDE